MTYATMKRRPSHCNTTGKRLRRRACSSWRATCRLPRRCTSRRCACSLRSGPPRSRASPTAGRRTVRALQIHTADLLQTHCRYTADTLQIHCRHTADTLHTHCRYTAGTLQIHCIHTADTLQIHCRYTADALHMRCQMHRTCTAHPRAPAYGSLLLPCLWSLLCRLPSGGGRGGSRATGHKAASTSAAPTLASGALPRLLEAALLPDNEPLMQPLLLLLHGAAQLLPVLDDKELFAERHPFRPDELALMAAFCNRVAFRLTWECAEQTTAPECKELREVGTYPACTQYSARARARTPYLETLDTRTTHARTRNDAGVRPAAHHTLRPRRPTRLLRARRVANPGALGWAAAVRARAEQAARAGAARQHAVGGGVRAPREHLPRARVARAEHAAW